jgi:hypothetical protein
MDLLVSKICFHIQLVPLHRGAQRINNSGILRITVRRATNLPNLNVIKKNIKPVVELKIHDGEYDKPVVGLYKLNAVDPWLESASTYKVKNWFLVSSLCFFKCNSYRLRGGDARDGGDGGQPARVRGDVRRPRA